MEIHGGSFICRRFFDFVDTALFKFYIETDYRTRDCECVFSVVGNFLAIKVQSRVYCRTKRENILSKGCAH